MEYYHKAEHPEWLNKTITVYCNAEYYSLKLWMRKSFIIFLFGIFITCNKVILLSESRDILF